VGHDVVDGDASEPVEQNPVRQDWIVFPAGEGVTDKFIRSKDWSKTPLGPIEFWPQSLRTTVSLALASQSPSNVIWGPQRIQLYNPAYRSILGDEMAQDIGRDYLQCWSWMREPLEHAFVNARAGEAAGQLVQDIGNSKFKGVADSITNLNGTMDRGRKGMTANQQNSRPEDDPYFIGLMQQGR